MNEAIRKIMKEQHENLKGKSLPDTGSGDIKCPFTGGLKLHGRTFTGIVVSKDTHRTVKVSWKTRHFVKKFERFTEKKTKVAAHNPDVISAKIGDRVIIAECRPISKTKKFVIIKNLGHSKDYMIKKESIEDDQKIVNHEKEEKAKKLAKEEKKVEEKAPVQEAKSDEDQEEVKEKEE